MVVVANVYKGRTLARITASVMINTTIHDPVRAQLLAQASKCRHFEDVLLSADDFISAATLYLSANASKSESATTTLVDAGEKYGKLLYENDGAFDVSTDPAFEAVDQMVTAVKNSASGMAAKWEKMVDCYEGHDMEHIQVVLVS